MPTDYTLAELAALGDVSVRTIRFYLAQGLLPAPGRVGPQTRYPESTLYRLRLIRQLQRGHLPLAEIRNRIAGLDDRDIQAILAEPVEPPSNSALEYVRGVLAGAPPAPPAAPRPGPPLAGIAPISRSLLKRLESTPTPGPVKGWATLAAPTAPPQAPDQPPPAPSHEPSQPQPPTQPERSQWERIELEPDIELHVRRPLSRIANKRVDRLIAFAQQLRKEDER